MGVIIYSFNLNVSPKMSYGVLECCYVSELHAYDFVIKRGIICARPYMSCLLYTSDAADECVNV